MKSALALALAALALSASSAFAQAQPAPATTPAKVVPAAKEVKLPDIDANAFPQVKAGILEAIDARVKLLQDDRKCVAAAADGKAVNACKTASENRQRAMIEQMRRSQSQSSPAIVGAPVGAAAGAAHR